MFQPPFIHDPGNGPRVRDARIFMSSFFAQPVALDVGSLLSSACILTYIPLARTHFVRNSLRKRFYKCCAPFCLRKPHWYVSIVLSTLPIIEGFSDSVVQ
jgi:hypothetical protein